MESQFKSYTIMPSDLYVERMADRQIVNIINNMQRPGYVLVSRQMGKTNLLLHTKMKMEDERNIFVYLDFSSIPVYDDKMFFSLLVDSAIEQNSSVFEDASKMIKELRETRLYGTANRYTAEVICLLKCVDKLVFILDEVDALARNKSANSIFSQIRSDYFQRINYPELNKLTYILSGVIEPKDLISDPNISPFNIGEKIILKSFSKQESARLINQAALGFSEETINRITYWTCGHPRILNDLCNDLQYYTNPTPEDVDEVVYQNYIYSYDRPPIDHIRELLRQDEYLQESYIQFFYSPETTSADMKQKLLLAGIVDNAGCEWRFKNPIIEKALPIEWVKSLTINELNILAQAEKLVFFKKSYNKAIRVLERYISLGKATVDELNKAYYFIGVCYFRLYSTDESIRYLNRINIEADDKVTILNSLLIKGYNYSNLGKFAKCIECYDSILKQCSKDDDLYAKACIGKVDALIQMDGMLDEARNILLSFISLSDKRFYAFKTVACYELSALEDACGNVQKALNAIEEAIQYADDSEMPTLLYYKMQVCHDESLRRKTLDRLLSYLSSYDKKPEIEDFDQMLSLNYSFLSAILSDVILNYPDYVSRIDMFLNWFNDTREAAYNSIVKYLRDFEPEKALPFAKYILRISAEENWSFGSDHIFNALSIIFKFEANSENARKLYDYIEANNYTDQRKEVAVALYSVTREFIALGDFNKAYKVINFFNANFSSSKDVYVIYLTYIFKYLTAMIDIKTKDIANARKSATVFFDIIKEIDYDEMSEVYENVSERFNSMASNIREALVEKQSNMPDLMNKYEYGKIGRNEFVTVLYYESGKQVSGKYKKFLLDLEAGLCRVVRVIK